MEDISLVAIVMLWEMSGGCQRNGVYIQHRRGRTSLHTVAGDLYRERCD
jgi:hypothetical protein